MPETVTELDVAAFDQCPNLESVIFEGRQVKIGSSNFLGCPKLKIFCPIASTTETQLRQVYGGPIEYLDSGHQADTASAMV